MPAYTVTQSGYGLGSTLKLNTGTVLAPVWTIIGEITDMQITGRQVTTDDATNLQSAGKEFIPVIKDEGTWELTLNRQLVDPGQLGVNTMFSALTVKQFQGTLQKSQAQTTEGDEFTFFGLVISNSFTVSPLKIIQTKMSIKVSGAMTEVVGT